MKKVKLNNGATVELKNGKVYNVLDDPNGAYKGVTIRNGQYVDSSLQTNDVTNAARQQTSINAKTIDLGDNNSPNSQVQLSSSDDEFGRRNLTSNDVQEIATNRRSATQTSSSSTALQENNTIDTSTLNQEQVNRPAVNVTPQQQAREKLNARRSVVETKTGSGKGNGSGSESKGVKAESKNNSQNNGYYKGTRQSKNGNYGFIHDGKGGFVAKTWLSNGKAAEQKFTRRNGETVAQAEQRAINEIRGKHSGKENVNTGYYKGTRNTKNDYYTFTHDGKGNFEAKAYEKKGREFTQNYKRKNGETVAQSENRAIKDFRKKTGAYLTYINKRDKLIHEQGLNGILKRLGNNKF